MQASNWLGLLLESMTDHAIFAVDHAGHVQMWSAGARRMTGFATDDMLGRHLSVLYLPHVEEQAARHLQLARTEGHTYEEGWRRGKHGAAFWASFAITALVEKGQCRGFGIIMQECTERKQTDEEIAGLLVLERQRRQQAESQLERSRIAVAVSAAALTRRVGGVMVAVLQQATRVLQADNAIVFGQRDGQLIVWATAGVGKAQWPAPIAVGSGFAGKVAAERRAMVISDTCDCGAPLPAGATGVSTVLAAPMVNAGQLIGVLQVGSHQAGHFRKRDLLLLQHIADVAARAIVYPSAAG